jgi:TrmH family RNA methyltransferase
MTLTISSLQNEKIKQVAKLNKRSVRDQLKLTVVEGSREIGLALDAGFVPQRVFKCPSLFDSASAATANRCEELAESGKTEIYVVTPAVYARIAYRGGVGGLVAVVPSAGTSFDEVQLPSSALGLVVDSAEKPGNLGALLRTADAAGVAFVIVCGDGTDISNPNVIRASLGAVFGVPLLQSDFQTSTTWLRENSFQIVATSPEAVTNYTETDLAGRTAIVMGAEADGLSREWLDAADVLVRIPMHGRVDSLNLSAATAILVYEAVRQRTYFDHCPRRTE